MNVADPSERLAEIEARVEAVGAECVPDCRLGAHAREDIPWLLEREKKLREGFAIEYEWRHVETCGCKRRAALRTPDSGCKLPLPRALADNGEGERGGGVSGPVVGQLRQRTIMPPGWSVLLSEDEFRLLLAAVEAAREVSDSLPADEFLMRDSPMFRLREALDALYATAPERGK